MERVIEKLVLHYPDQALQKLEEVSMLLKKDNTEQALQNFLRLDGTLSHTQVAKDQEEYVAKMKPCF